MPVLLTDETPARLSATLQKTMAEATLRQENRRLIALTEAVHAYHAAAEKGLSFLTFMDDPKWKGNWLVKKYPEVFAAKCGPVGLDTLGGAFLDEKEEFKKTKRYARLSQVGKVQCAYMFDLFDRALSAHMTYALPSSLPGYDGEPVARMSANMIRIPDADKEFRRVWWDGEYLAEAKAHAKGNSLGRKEIATSNLYREMGEFSFWEKKYRTESRAKPYFAYQMRALAASTGDLTPPPMHVFLDTEPPSLEAYTEATWEKIRRLADIDYAPAPVHPSYTKDEVSLNPIFAELAAKDANDVELV